MRHILGVDVIPTNNDQILHLFDTSVYADGLGVTCPQMVVNVPGFNTPIQLEPNQNFNLALNGVDLNIINPLADYLPALPDGIYTINYSVAPNKLVFVEIDYLRTVLLDQKILRFRCALGLGPCTPDDKTNKQILQLNEIEDYLKAARAYVHCNQPEKAIELFNYAQKLLTRLTANCSTC